MKVVDTLAAVGVMTLIYIGCKIVLAANEVFGPISTKKKGDH